MLIYEDIIYLKLKNEFNWILEVLLILNLIYSYIYFMEGEVTKKLYASSNNAKLLQVIYKKKRQVIENSNQVIKKKPSNDRKCQKNHKSNQSLVYYLSKIKIYIYLVV